MVRKKRGHSSGRPNLCGYLSLAKRQNLCYDMSVPCGNGSKLPKVSRLEIKAPSWKPISVNPLKSLGFQVIRDLGNPSYLSCTSLRFPEGDEGEKCMEWYRRGHNGPDSKSGKPLTGSVGSNPTHSAIKALQLKGCRAFFMRRER